MRSLALLALLALLPAPLLLAPAAMAQPSTCQTNVVSVGNAAGVCTYTTLRRMWEVNNEGPVCVLTSCPGVGQTGPYRLQPCVLVWSNLLVNDVSVCP